MLFVFVFAFIIISSLVLFCKSNVSKKLTAAVFLIVLISMIICVAIRGMIFYKVDYPTLPIGTIFVVF